MQRFYFDIELKNKILIDDKEFFHQVSHVLRSRIGDKLNLFNGDSYEYMYEISGISKKGVELDFVSKDLNKTDPDIYLTIYQAIPNKFEKIDYIVQKGVEIGISEFIFFRAERSSKLIVSDNKVSRYENIIKESLEQCYGNIKPKVTFIDKLNLGEIKGDSFVCDTKGTENLSLMNNEKKDKINIFIGPEGGFSDKELLDFKNSEFGFINFGKRILRTETVSSVLGFWIINKL